MIQETLTQTLAHLANLKLWGLFISLTILHSAYHWVIHKTTTQAESTESAAPGCLTQILSILFLGILLGGGVLLLMNILFNQPFHLQSTFFSPLGFFAIKAGILGVVGLTLLTMIPFLGRWIASSPGIETYLLGSFIAFFLFKPFIKTMQSSKEIVIHIPSSIKFLLIGLALTYLFTKIFKALSLLPMKFFKNSKDWGVYLGPNLDFMAGLLGVLVYLSYLQINIA